MVLKEAVQFFQYARRVGLGPALRMVTMTKEFKVGDLKGRDQFGNAYYESMNEQLGRTRWVKYANPSACRYDPSQVPPEWHPWLHYMTDETPGDTKIESPPYGLKFQPNQTWNSNAYYPPGHFLTKRQKGTQPAYERWTGGKKKA